MPQVIAGLFDSGSGGLNTVRYIKANDSKIDLVYHIDRRNAPYGIKSSEEIVRITEENIEELRSRGAEQVLIACCTASSVYKSLDKSLRRFSIPIIAPIAKMAKAVTKNKHVAVIATERTILSHSFGDALGKYCSDEIITQELVKMIDDGVSDDNMDRDSFDKLYKILFPLENTRADTLILGCTHFPSLINSIGTIVSNFGIKYIIDSAKVGATALIGKAHRQMIFK